MTLCGHSGQWGKRLLLRADAPHPVLRCGPSGSGKDPPEPAWASVADQVVRLHHVPTDVVARRGFQREGEGDREVLAVVVVVAHAEAQRAGPTAEVPIHGVELFLHPAIADVVVVRRAEAPVFAQAIENRTAECVRADAKLSRLSAEVVAQIKVAEAPAPAVVGPERQAVEGH